MTRFVAATALISACCLFTAGADAQESMNLGRAPTATPLPTEVQYAKGDWEVQLYWGHIVPLKKNTFSYDIPNERVYDLLGGELAEEVAEGFVAPPSPGNSTVAGTFKNFSEIGLQVFYRLRPWLAVGGQFGYGIKRDTYIDNRGIYDPSNWLMVDMHANIYHLNAPVKLGDWIGRFRPHISLGPGMYFTQEEVNISFTDPDDPEIAPKNVISKDHIYFGATAGAGVDVRVTERGRLSLACEYHKVFSPLGRLDFLLPKLTFSVAF